MDNGKCRLKRLNQLLLSGLSVLFLISCSPRLIQAWHWQQPYATPEQLSIAQQQCLSHATQTASIALPSQESLSLTQTTRLALFQQTQQNAFITCMEQYGFYPIRH